MFSAMTQRKTRMFILLLGVMVASVCLVIYLTQYQGHHTLSDADINRVHVNIRVNFQIR